MSENETQEVQEAPAEEQQELDVEVTTYDTDGTSSKDEPEETETQEAEGSDAEETEETEQKPKIEFSPEQQEFINKEIMGKKVARLHQIQDELEQTRQRLNQYESQRPQNQPPEVPPLPNMYDPDFEQKMKERDNKVAERIRFDEQQRAQSERALYEQQQAERQQAEQMNTRIQSYSQRAEANGINPATLQQAGAVVGNFLQDQSLVNYILEDESGPSITVWLAKNPAEAQKVAQMDYGRAAVYIEKAIKPKATRASKPKDPPPTVLRGKGAPERQPGPAGATFENYN